MKELFNIIPNSTGDGFRMKLSTGVIDVPNDNGGYIISSGCGSGKTESIKSLIRQKYNSGILYCVDTRDELGKMYDWILANLVNRELGYGDILRESDVMIISSDKERSSFLNQYRDNPEILMDKKIILITHVRFWTDLINYFLIYRPQVPVDSFDGDFKKLMVRPDLRRYILFDETPTFIRPFVEFDKTVLGVFSKTDDTGNIICMSPEEIEIYYDHFIRNTRNDLFNRKRLLNYILCIRFFIEVHSIVSASRFFHMPTYLRVVIECQSRFFPFFPAFSRNCPDYFLHTSGSSSFRSLSDLGAR